MNTKKTKIISFFLIIIAIVELIIAGKYYINKYNEIKISKYEQEIGTKLLEMEVTALLENEQITTEEIEKVLSEYEEIIYDSNEELVGVKVASNQKIMISDIYSEDTEEVTIENLGTGTLAELYDKVKELEENLGGNTLTYNADEDAYYIQNEDTTESKKLGSEETFEPILSTVGLSHSDWSYEQMFPNGSSTIKCEGYSTLSINVLGVNNGCNLGYKLDDNDAIALSTGEYDIDVTNVSEIVIYWSYHAQPISNVPNCTYEYQLLE